MVRQKSETKTKDRKATHGRCPRKRPATGARDHRAIDSVRFGDEDMTDRVKLVCIEAIGEFAGTPIPFWCNTKNKDGLLSPSMKLYQILEASHGEGWTKKIGTLETAIQALRGKYIAGTSVPKDVKKGGVGNNLKDGTIEAVPEDFEPEA